MKILIRTLYAELLKFKRTLALWLTVIAPAAIVFMHILVYLQTDAQFPPNQNPWIRFTQGVLVFWGLLTMPLFVTLETALAGSLEHREEHWKHLFALPVPRWMIYTVKQCSGMLLIGISSAVLPFLVLLGGGLLHLLRPNLGLMTTPIPLKQLFTFVVPVYVSAWLIISIQTWVNLRWKNFVLSSALGMTMTILAIAAVSSDWGSYYPWALPGLVANSFTDGFGYLQEVLLGGIGGVIVALLGGWDVVRQDVL